ncbi:MAG TPA: YaiO family outer membrane beta-barrel protein [Geothrix sp.]|nr:YaiO family outer membrane beta-barrel protein [Geothrix sp.]
MTSRDFIAPLLLLALAYPLQGQAPPAPSNPAPEGVDDLFARARKLAFSGKRLEAIGLCREALKRSPGYQDIRILLGRILAWESRYDEGREELQKVLRAQPDYLDGRVALVDLELWSDHPGTALNLCDEGLALRPAQPPLLFRKARALKAIGRYPEALQAAQAAVVADPDFYEARTLAENLVELTQRNKLGLSYTFDRFDRTFDPWRLTSLSLSHRFDAGSLIGRVNHTSRFGETGQQFEVDAYPRWGDGTYFYLNAGFSDATLFPHRRYGVEIFQNFPKGMEGSLGFRRLQFTASRVTIYTGSLSKYWGDWLFTLRPNYTPSSLGASRSGSIAVRRYLGDAENYLTFSLGTGVSPDQPNPDASILDLRSRKAGLSAQGWLSRRFILSGGLAYEKQEIGQGIERAQTTLNAGLEWRF